jgi:glycosyltransferase involved in cell wall biosynthesis
MWYENAPLVIHEAFATQTPVITTNIGGMAEAVSHEQNGLLFERNDIVDLGRQLDRIISEPGLLARIRQGIPKVKTVDEEVDELEQLYRELIQSNR